jgi:hypothetical protein
MTRYFLAAAVLASSFVFPVRASLTAEQRLDDFRALAALYAKNYAPYEWKRDAIGFDLYDLRPWLARVAAAADDLEFYDICIDYVSSLRDGHVNFLLPASFIATLGFSVDIYESKVLVDAISRSRLPAAQFPFQIGDELVSVDGRTPEEYIAAFSKYAMTGNPDSTRRAAVLRITSRPQVLMPRAHEIGTSATVVVRRASGNVETYTIPWLKTGLAIQENGPVPGFKTVRRAVLSNAAIPTDDSLSPYLLPLAAHMNDWVPEGMFDAVGMGARTPIFSLPSGFVLRLGRAAADVFYSGTYTADGLRIGFIRIPSFSPPSTTAAVQQFRDEMIFMQANTDGLIIDDMRNPGGLSCYNEQIQALLMPRPFRTLGREIRATAEWLASYSQALDSARSGGAPDWVIRLYESHLDAVYQAFSENRGRTGPLPVCGPGLDLQPARDNTGKVIAYSKPIVVLIDGFSASAGDAFAAVFQDNKRGILFGERTMGLGGSVVEYPATMWSEASARVTINLMNRIDTITTRDLLPAPYVENIGVRPDIEMSYMTRDNLLSGGRNYVNAFTNAIVDLIRKSP